MLCHPRHECTTPEGGGTGSRKTHSFETLTSASRAFHASGVVTGFLLEED